MKFYTFDGKVRAVSGLTATKRNEPEVVVSVFSPGTAGPHPCIPVRDVYMGFDWDSGKLIIHPEQPLTALTPEQVADITDSVRKGQSWHAYQQHKAHRVEVAELKRQRDDLIQVLEQIRDTIVVNELRLQLASIEAGVKAAIDRVKGGAA